MTTDMNDEQRLAVSSTPPVDHDGGSCERPPSTSEMSNPFYDVWTCSIHMNNLGLDHLMHGRLHDAWGYFFEANNLQRQASYLPRYNDSSLEYESIWVNVQSIVDSIATSYEMKRAMRNIFLFGLRIGDDIDDSYDSDDQETECAKCAKVDILRTTRIDWATSYNMGLVTQLLGSITTGVWGMTLRADAFDRYEKLKLDVVAEYDGIAPVDAALLMMALYNNQGSIYRQLEVDYQVEAYWGRMRKIMNSSRSLREHSICQTFLHNLEFLAREERRPAAAA